MQSWQRIFSKDRLTRALDYFEYLLRMGIDGIIMYSDRDRYVRCYKRTGICIPKELVLRHKTPILEAMWFPDYGHLEEATINNWYAANHFLDDEFYSIIRSNFDWKHTDLELMIDLHSLQGISSRGHTEWDWTNPKQSVISRNQWRALEPFDLTEQMNGELELYWLTRYVAIERR